MEIKELIPIAMFILTLVGILGSYFKAKGMDEAQQKVIDGKLNDLHDIDEKQWEAIDKNKAWQSAHEKEASQRRLELELKIAGVDGLITKLTEKLDIKLDDIARRLAQIEKDVKRGD